jgi:hypothetical protein
MLAERQVPRKTPGSSRDYLNLILSADPEVQSKVLRRLADFADCAGECCRSAEDA